MDFRLVKELRRWMEKKGYLCNCDVVSLAGASKEMLDGGEETRELIFKQIGLASTLHGASEVILVHHSDCGAYKGTYNFVLPEEEKKKQLEDMAKAEVMIKDKFAAMKVMKVWAQLQDENGKMVDFQEVQ
jgi:hypothetical protein